MLRGYLVSGILISMVGSAELDFQPARIHTADGSVSYQLTPDDVLLAARAVSYESKLTTDPAKVLWTLTQRWVMWQKRGKRMSFRASTESFSQPLNPEWRQGGPRCKANPQDCTQAALDRRKEAATATWGDLIARDGRLGLNAVAATRAWAQARLSNPVPNVTNFAVTAVASNYIEANRSSTVFERDDDGHWYIIDPPATRWPVNYVTMISSTGEQAGVTGTREHMVKQAVESFWDSFTLRSVFW